MNDTSTRSVIQGLETLQQLRGALMNIVLDAHKSHMSLLNDKEHDKRTVLHRLLQGNTKLLGNPRDKTNNSSFKKTQEMWMCRAYGTSGKENIIVSG